MKVSTLEVRLLVRESRSLKDKRQVVRSVLDRLRGTYNVAAAEVGTRDDHRVATLGFAAVAEEAGDARRALESIANALRGHPVAEFLGCEFDAGLEPD